MIILGQVIDETPWKEQFITRVAHGWSAWNHVPTIDETDMEAVTFSALEPVPEQMRRQDLWRLQYKRRPYMNRWTNDQINKRWEEVLILGMFAFLKEAPIKTSKELTTEAMQVMTHLMEEFGQRGITLPMRQPTQSRLIEAAERVKVPQRGLAWLKEWLSEKPIGKDGAV